MTDDDFEARVRSGDPGFASAYMALAELGACDDFGSAESQRVHGEWVAAGRPAEIEAFIRDRANMVPPVGPPTVTYSCQDMAGGVVVGRETEAAADIASFSGPDRRERASSWLVGHGCPATEANALLGQALASGERCYRPMTIGDDASTDAR